MNEIRKHVFVCVNERDENNPRGCCSSKGSLEVMTLLKRIIKQKGISDIRVNKSGCLGCCEKGISCVVYPDSEWYTIPNEKDAIMVMAKNIISGEKTTDYLMYDED